MNFLILSLCLFNFTFAGLYNGKHTYIHAKILNCLVKEISDKYNVEVYSKGGSFVYNLKSFNISFRYKKPIDLQSAEKIFYEINQKFLNTYNSDLRIRPYLDVYPFTPDRIEIGLWLSGNKCVGDISRIRRYGNIILYSFIGEDGRERKIESDYLSLYNHAYGLMQNQDELNR